MSRYNHTVVRDNVRYVVSYGYDDPLSEFFLHVERCDMTGEADDEDEGLIFAIANVNTLKCHPDHPDKIRWNNSEILEVMTQWEVPSWVQTRVALDLKF